MGMRFCRSIPNSLRNKNMKRHILVLLKKIVFLIFKTLLFPIDTSEKDIFIKFKFCNLTNG
jgi:hypothetical protein